MRVKLEALKTAVDAIKHDALRDRFGVKYKRLSNKVEDVEAGEYDEHFDSLEDATATLHRKLDLTLKLVELADEWMTVETTGTTDLTLKAGGVVVTYNVTPDSLNLVGFVRGEFRLAFYPCTQFAAWAKEQSELLTVLAMRYKVTKVLMGDTVFDAIKGRVSATPIARMGGNATAMLRAKPDPAVGWWGQTVVPEGSVVSVQ